MRGSIGSPRQEGWERRRPSPSSGSFTPPSKFEGRQHGAGGSNSAERRRATRQPGDASGVLVVWPRKERHKKRKQSKSKSGLTSNPEEETSVGALKSFLAQGKKRDSSLGEDANDGDSSCSEGSPGGSTSWARRRNRQKRNASGPATSPSSSTSSKESSSEGALHLRLEGLGNNGSAESKVQVVSDAAGNNLAGHDDDHLSDAR